MFLLCSNELYKPLVSTLDIHHIRHLNLNGKRGWGCFIREFLGVFSLLEAFRPFSRREVGHSFFSGLSALSFGIGAKRSNYYGIDIPVKTPPKGENALSDTLALK